QAPARRGPRIGGHQRVPGHGRCRTGEAVGRSRRARRGQPAAHEGDQAGRPAARRGAPRATWGYLALRTAAHAKVNLGLAVLARRGDSFHEIETLITRLRLADDVEVTLREGPPGEVTLASV